MHSSLLITLEYPPDIGGVGAYYKQQVREIPNIEVLHLKQTEKPLHWVSFFKFVINKVKRDNSAYLRVGHILPLGYIALFIKWIYNKPYIVYVHGLDIFQGSLTGWKRFWIKRILNGSDEVVTNSYYVMERTIREYHTDPSKCKVVYPTVDAVKIKKEAATIAPISKKGGEKIVLSVGRLVKRKGFDKVIEAVQKLPAHYYIVGEGKDRKRLENLVEKCKVQDTVTLAGAVPTPEIYGYYKAADVFIMPSREINGDVEGFGLVFLEADVFNLPVIGGKSGGVPEAIAQCESGHLVDPENVEEIVDVLETVLQ